jgi:hypothetical protein
MSQTAFARRAGVRYPGGRLLATDPKDYRFCGYAEAVAGNKPARAGLAHIIGEGKHWPAVQAAYRETLFGKGSAPKEHAAAISPEQFEQALKNKTRLPLATVLRCRIRYFTDGAVLGGKAFVAQHLARYRRKFGRREGSAPRPLPPLTALRGLRKQIPNAPN